MEEKEIKKEETGAESKKFTYEQLTQIASSLSAQVQQLSIKLQESNLFNMFKRLDYCFKVLETPTTLFTPDFVEKCAKEIEEIMTTSNEVLEETDKEK